MSSIPPPAIMGGLFGLETNFQIPAHAPFLKPGSLLFANARSAIHVVIDVLKPARFWAPSYLCNSILQGAANASVLFYPVSADLTVRDLDGIRQGDLLLIIDYFGFRAARRVFDHAKSFGAWVLEDACQALLTADIGQRADFSLFSPRKFVGVPDGAVLQCPPDFDSESVRLYEPPLAWSVKTLQAAIFRRDFDIHAGDREWFGLGQQIERECPVGYFAISSTAKAILQTLDYDCIAQRRCENYQCLLRTLGNYALFPDLPEGAVPLGFPIRLRERDKVREALYRADIYPPVHWPVAGVVPDLFADSHQLSREIMTLPCDQRYTDGDMERMAAVVLTAVNAL